MESRWFRRDRPAVLDAYRRGDRPLMAPTTPSGPLDELLALRRDWGHFDGLDHLPVDRHRLGLDEAWLFRTLATLSSRTR